MEDSAFVPGSSRVVVFHQGALGDFLLAASGVESLWRARPGMRIDYWSKPDHVRLLCGKGYLGGCYCLDGPVIPSLFHESLWKEVRLPDFLTQAEQVIVFGQQGTRILAGRLSKRLAARVDWIQSFPSVDSPVHHVTEFIVNQLRQLGLPVSDERPVSIQAPEDELEAMRRFLWERRIDSPPVIIHPGSGGRRKVFPLRNWRGLIDLVRNDLGAPVLLSIGPADEFLKDFAREIQRIGVPLAQGLSLTALAALLAQCRLYVGSDSGVTHLAAVVGAPTLAIFGPTDPRVWGPRGANVRIVQRVWDESVTPESAIPCSDVIFDAELREMVLDELGKAPD